VILICAAPLISADAKSSISEVNIDSLKSEITANGFNENSNDKYLFYLINSNINYDLESEFLKSIEIKNNFIYLPEIILLKKKEKYLEAYKIAAARLINDPDQYLFYEELVWLAGATQNLSKLKGQISNSKNTGRLKYLTGLLEFNEGKYSNAKNIFNQLLKDEKSKEIYFWLSYTDRYLGDYGEAIINLSNAMELIEKSDPYYEKILNAMGSLQYLSGNYQNAEELYKRSFEKSRSNGNNIEFIKSNINLAILDDESGDIVNARKKLSLALFVAEEINANELSAIVHSELGVSYTYDSQLTKAERHYSAALEIYKRFNGKGRLASLYNNLGKIYLSLFNYKLALEYFKKGLDAAGENVRGQIINLTQIADVYTNLANYSEALKYYNRANELSKKIKEVSLQFEVQLGFGMLDYNLGRFSKSLNYFNNAKGLINEKENPYEFAEVNHKIGLAYFALDSNNLAQEYFNAAIDIYNKYEDIYSRLLTEYDLVQLHIKLNESKKAKIILNNSKKIIEKYELNYLLALNYLYNAKIAELDEKRSNAIEFYEKASEYADQLNNENIEIEALYGMAVNYSLNHNMKNAELYFNKIRDLIESRSSALINNSFVQISYFASFDKIYDQIIEFYLNQNNAQKAFEVLDASRSRNTMQNVSNLKIAASIDDPALLKKYFDLKWEASSEKYTKSEKDSLKNYLNKITSDIIEFDPKLKKYLNPAPSLNLAEIQSSMNDSTLFLSVYITDNVTYLFLIGSNKFEYFKKQISRSEISDLLTQISPYYSPNGFKDELIFNQDLFSFNVQKANELYEKLFKDIFEFTGENKNIIISTSSELLNFPIESLVSKYFAEKSPFNFSETKFLVEDFNITYAPSANIYLELQKFTLNSEGENLLVGDPIVTNNDFYINYRSSLFAESDDLNQVKLNHLEYSKDEIASINSIVGTSVSFTSVEATEINFKKFAPLSSLIHISSHSFLLNEQPFIVFSENEKSDEDSFLEIGEILQLKLNSDLVVLSSCKSGLGEVDKREGILGMQKAFFDAGARSVVVSLWDVNDKYTYLFMELFYKNLKAGFSKSAALKNAKLNFIKEYSPNPYYWAAFVLSGNTAKIEFLDDSNINYILLIIFISVILSALLFRKKYFKRKSGL
jgi:CHAT domain-containing protein/Flp pilus assembly protein TadD